MQPPHTLTAAHRRSDRLMQPPQASYTAVRSFQTSISISFNLLPSQGRDPGANPGVRNQSQLAFFFISFLLISLMQSTHH
ncbi:hypothetical protein V2G26_014577 [Clonostachys chloroleuca]